MGMAWVMDMGMEQVWADPRKAERELGWKADTPIEDVLRSAWEWQKTL